MTKVCTGCQLDKALTEYSPNKATKLGVQSRCKTCRRNDQRRDRQQPGRLKRTNGALPLGRQECDEICAKATAWLFKRYRDRGYTIEAIARLDYYGSYGLARKAAHRLGYEIVNDRLVMKGGMDSVAA